MYAIKAAFVACLHIYFGNIMFLLSTMAQMHPFPSQDGVTPLFAASQNNHGGIVTLLLNASALVDLARNVSSLYFIINVQWHLLNGRYAQPP